MTAPATDPDLESVAWDLSHLLDGAGDDPDAAVDAMLGEALRRAEAFAERTPAASASSTARVCARRCSELAEIQELAGRAGSYAMLDFSIDTADPPRGALLQRVQEKGTAIETALLFFELEWAALDDERADELLAAEGLDFARHHLRDGAPLPAAPALRARGEGDGREGAHRPHRLVAPVRGAGGGDHRRARATASEPASLEIALSRLFSPDREVRRDAAERVTAGLQPGLRTRAFVFNTLLADKTVDDRLRRYPHWLAEPQPRQRGLRRVGRGADRRGPRALRAAAPLVPAEGAAARARPAGRLRPPGRRSPRRTRRSAWPEARDLVLDSYGAFSPELGDLARRFFDERWIDAPVRPNKRGGAFCAYTVPSVHPYVLLNYTHRRRDVLTLAHELGHGVHAALGGRQGVFHMSTPLTLAETASVFGETLVFGRLLEQAETPESRLSLLAESIEGSIATVFRQVAMNRFEHLVHTERRERGRAGGRAHRRAVGGVAGGAAGRRRRGHRGLPLVVVLRARTSSARPATSTPTPTGSCSRWRSTAATRRRATRSCPAYLELLAAGGSRSPEELGRIVGVDLADPGFWDLGLALVERQLEAAEAAAADTGRLAD